jgi:hypothetical protein
VCPIVRANVRNCSGGVGRGWERMVDAKGGNDP